MKFIFKAKARLGENALTQDAFENLIFESVEVRFFKETVDLLRVEFHISYYGDLQNLFQDPINWHRNICQEVFPIATFLSNFILFKTGIDALNPKDVFFNTPDVIPENEEDIAAIQARKFWHTTAIPCTATIVRPLKFETALRDFPFSLPIAYFASYKKTNDDILRFELLFKILEYFFNKKSDRFDSQVISFVKKNGLGIPPKKVKHLRDLRNRCVHPHAEKGRINPHHIKDLQEVQGNIGFLEKMAIFLIENPGVINAT